MELSLIHVLFMVLFVVMLSTNAHDVSLSNRLFEDKGVKTGSSLAPSSPAPIDIGLISLPYPGHLSPLLTLADHLAAVGHKVTIYSTDEALRSLPVDFIRNQARRECELENYHMRMPSIAKYLCGCMTNGKKSYPSTESDRALFKEVKNTLKDDQMFQDLTLMCNTLADSATAPELSESGQYLSELDDFLLNLAGARPLGEEDKLEVGRPGEVSFRSDGLFFEHPNVEEKKIGVRKLEELHQKIDKENPNTAHIIEWVAFPNPHPDKTSSFKQAAGPPFNSEINHIHNLTKITNHEFFYPKVRHSESIASYPCRKAMTCEMVSYKHYL